MLDCELLLLLLLLFALVTQLMLVWRRFAHELGHLWLLLLFVGELSISDSVESLPVDRFEKY